MVAQKLARKELKDVGEETKGKLNVDEHRGRIAAEKEMKNNAMFDEWR